MTQNSILLLDDSSGRSSDFLQFLQNIGVKTALAGSEKDARQWLRQNQCQAVLLHVDRLEPYRLFLDEMGELAGGAEVIVAARKGSVGDAVAALKAGAADYIEPPLDSDRLEAALLKAGVLVVQENEQDAGGRGCGVIVGNSKKMQQVFRLIKKICDADTTVLVRGESGTGKELIAQALHYEGARAAAPFVPVNCGAIPGELLESELFGHEKGAFTHAIRTRLGRFELAHGGTVFLDEISEMSPMLQVKLLRVLQEKQFERIGGTKTIRSDFRVVAATNRDLEEEVREGRFREDLYYRLNVIPIDAPPLRERTDDIPLLVEHFVQKFNRSKKKKIKSVASEAMDRLLCYGWPGNVRELENMVERMVILSAGDKITLSDVPEKLLDIGGQGMVLCREEALAEIPDQGFFLNTKVADFEKGLILQALNQTNWVKNRAAKLLNVNRTTLIEKMKRFKLTAPPSEA